ncbi:hypothetical protein B0O99DRAFT_692007 [Bisporella sp. PMI_857]|nr:hypothetical protein B0O99DRAFT_692007 [Bisporella sp. PMI_857]
MDPGGFRTFGWHAEKVKNPSPDVRLGEGRSNKGEACTGKGLGAELGEVTLDNGTVIDAWRTLMRDTWNAKLHGPLENFIYTHPRCRTARYSLPQKPKLWNL